MRYRQLPDAADQYMAKMGQRVRKLETMPRIGDTSIDNGRMLVKDAAGAVVVGVGKSPASSKYGFEVYDAITGAVQLRVGELESSVGYGMEAVDDNGKLVTLANLAFGVKAAFNSTGITIPDNNGSWVSNPVGPNVQDVLIGDSGRCIVFLSARINCTVSTGIASSGYMGVQISGATSVAPDFYKAVGFETGTDGITINGAFIDLVDGLNPGLHDFSARYATFSSGGTDSSDFIGQSIVVLPY